jgi:hypothetical protein
MTYANEPTLADRAAEINRLYEGVDKADGAAKRKRIEVGKALIEARKHVPAGEWNAWCKANIPRSRQDIARVMRMAGAEDPEAAHEAENAARRATAGRNTVLHAATVAELPPPAVLAEGGFFGPQPQHETQAAPVEVEVSAGITNARTVSADLSPAERATQEQWETSVSNHAGEAIAMEAYWTRLFGDWRRFEPSSTLATLAKQAADAWTELHARLAAPVPVEVEVVEGITAVEVEEHGVEVEATAEPIAEVEPVEVEIVTGIERPVEVELDRSAPWKSLAAATEAATVAESNRQRKPTVPMAARPAPIEFVVVKSAPRNRRSKIGEVRQATPEAIAAYNAKFAAARAA